MRNRFRGIYVQYNQRESECFATNLNVLKKTFIGLYLFFSENFKEFDGRNKKKKLKEDIFKRSKIKSKCRFPMVLLLLNLNIINIYVSQKLF